ncbi:hypothetical protein ACFQE1_21095, partial [Halobium palmae]
MPEHAVLHLEALLADPAVGDVVQGDESTDRPTAKRADRGGLDEEVPPPSVAGVDVQHRPSRLVDVDVQ